jgi:predicted Zn-dependent peptidase
MQERLVRGQQVASSAVAFTFDLSRGADLLVLDVTAHATVSAEELEAAVVAEVDALRTSGVTAQEVERARTLTATEFVTSMQSAQSRADRLSQFATFLGAAAAINEQVERWQRVTPADVEAFARDWLGPDNRASLAFVPAQTSAAA